MGKLIRTVPLHGVFLSLIKHGFFPSEAPKCWYQHHLGGSPESLRRKPENLPFPAASGGLSSVKFEDSTQ